MNIRTWRVRHSGKVLAAVLTLTVLAGCSTTLDPSSQSDPASETRAEFTVVTPYPLSPSFTPEAYIANRSEASEWISVQEGQGSSQALQQVVAGNAQVAAVAGTDLINAANEGAPLVAIATKHTPLPFTIVSSSSDPVDSVKDLVGKNFGIISVGGSTEAMLDLMLTEEGIDLKSVERVVVNSNPGSLTLVEDGKVIAFVADTPTAAALKNANAEATYLNPNDFIPMPGQVLVARKDAVEADPAPYRDFLKAMASTFVQLQKDGESNGWRDSIEMFKDLGVDLGSDDVLKGKLDAQLPVWLHGRSSVQLKNDPALWASAVKLMEGAGMINSGLDPNSLFTNDLIPE